MSEPVGTFSVPRALWSDETFKDEPFTQREAWIWMISEASWRDRERQINGVFIHLKRGQFTASYRFMASRFKWSEPKVRRFVTLLRNRRTLETKTDAGQTIVTICNYDIIQNKPAESDAAATQQPTQQRRSSDANENKGINKTKGKTPPKNDQKTMLDDQKPKPRSKRLFDENWLPTDKARLWAKTQGFSDGEVNRMIAHCRDHHRSKGNKFLDHDATFKNWVRRQVEWSERDAKTNQPAQDSGTGDAKTDAILRRIAAKREANDHG